MAVWGGGAGTFIRIGGRVSKICGYLQQWSTDTDTRAAEKLLVEINREVFDEVCPINMYK